MKNHEKKDPFLFFPTITPLPFQTPKGTCAKSVKIAIDTGYRHIDGAYIYQNEHEVGEAIREKIAKGKVRREDIFYCGKVRSSLQSPIPYINSGSGVTFLQKELQKRVSSQLPNFSFLPRI